MQRRVTLASRQGATRLTTRRPRRAARAAALIVACFCLLLFAALAAGCGGEGSGGGSGQAAGGRPPAADEVRLVVSRDFGAEVLRDVVVPAGDGTDALRVLAENAEVDTGYGGQFVNGIDGLASSFGGGSAADAADWFYWVDGIMGDVGAADSKLKGGETVWWDFHRWADAMMVPLALHAFPRPYSGHPLAVTAATDVAGLGDWAAAAGLELADTEPLADEPADGGLVLATPAETAAASWVLELLDAAHGGVEMVRVTDGQLRLVSPDGQAGPVATAVAQPVGNTEHPERPFLVVLGVTAADLEAFVPRLTTEMLSATVAVALVDGEVVRLPWQGE
jgi:hypothetical protein